MRNEGNQCWPIFFSRPYHGQADITKAHLRSATSTYSRPSMCHSHQTPGDIALLRSGTSSKAILSPLGTTSCPTYDCEATSPEKKTISSDSPPVAVTRCSAGHKLLGAEKWRQAGGGKRHRVHHLTL